ncbi:MAG: hypothetical protein WCH34_13900 [Bacteroidota bacterium]
MEINNLAEILKQNYNNAYNGEMVAQIHLFGIKYGKIIRENKFTPLEIINKAELNVAYVAELNKGIKLAEFVCLENDEHELIDLAEILKEKYHNAKNGESVASIFLFGIKYGQLIRRKNISINELIKLSSLNDAYVTELNKGVKLSEYASIK